MRERRTTGSDGAKREKRAILINLLYSFFLNHTPALKVNLRSWTDFFCPFVTDSHFGLEKLSRASNRDRRNILDIKEGQEAKSQS